MKLPCPKPLVNGLGYILKTLDSALLPLDWTKNRQAIGLGSRGEIEIEMIETERQREIDRDR